MGSDGVTELVLERWATGGTCIAHADNQTWFVKYGAPGERVRVVVTRRAHGVVHADVIDVVSASPARVAPPCTNFGHGRCGGCDLQHVSLPEQGHAKRSIVVDCLIRIGGMDRDHVESAVGTTEQVPGSLDGLRWRTRMTARRTSIGIGLHRARSHELVDVSDCPITSTAVVGAVHEVVAPGLEFRAAEGTDGRVGIDTAAGSARVTQTVQTPRGVCTWSLPASAFWQVHRGFPQFLGDIVLRIAQPGPGDTWWDLYAGAGLIAAFLDGAGVARVEAVESDERAVKAARRALHDRGGVALHHRAVSAWLDSQRTPPAGVILDPPRRGCGPEVVDKLVAFQVPQIVYVACDPAAFARDATRFVRAGYRLVHAVPIDAFPMTHHVETVALLVHGDRLS